MISINGKQRDTIIFIGGLTAGLISGVVCTMEYFKKKYEKIANDRISDIEEFYRLRSKYVKQSEDVVTVRDQRRESRDESFRDTRSTTREDGVLSREERDNIRQKLLDNYARTSTNAVNYRDISMRGFTGSEDEDSNVPVMTPEEIADSDHMENKNKPPRIISIDEYTNLDPSIDTQTLYFYHYDMVIADDNDEEIVDYQSLIGDALTKYDFANSDEDVIFVMNYRLGTAYEIERVMGSYRDTEYE